MSLNAIVNPVKLSLLAVFLFATTGCAKQIFTMTAGMTERYSEDYMIPSVMKQSDLQTTCAMGEAMGAVTTSMAELNKGMDKIVIMTNMSAAMCSQQRAFEKNLEYLRQLKAGNDSDAQDARILMKRHYKEAAQRQLSAFELLNDYYGKVGDKCPRLLDEKQQLTYLAGLLSGLQAVSADTKATSGVVPRNIAARVERGAKCIKNEDWFGVPKAMRALLWTLLPGGTPAGEDPWARLEEAMAEGEAAGVRLPHVFYAMAAQSKNKPEWVRKAIKRHVAALKAKPANPDFVNLDAMATAQLREMSDLMWTEAKGHRTPFGELGTFWDEEKKQDFGGIDIDDL